MEEKKKSITIDPFDPIQRVIQEMLLSYEAGYFHAPMLMAFTLPDHCASLEHPKGLSEKKRYIDWVDKWVLLKLNGAEKETGEEFYKIRCKLAHQNMMTHEKSTYTGIAITIVSPQGNRFHNNVLTLQAEEAGPSERYLAIDLGHLVFEVAGAATRWYEQAKKTNPIVQANVEKLIYQHVGGHDTLWCDFFA